MLIKFLRPKNIKIITIKGIKITKYAFILFLALGLYYSFFNSPDDYLQGSMVKIMYIHVPSAWLSLMIYTIMALASLAYLVWLNPTAEIIARASASSGLTFSLITVVTGAIWGKPTWGTWWVFDARLTSMLILFFFYLGYILLINSFNDPSNSKAPSILVLIGFINIPIVKFSVDIWNSLHQPASIFKLSGPTIDISMLIPLMLMFASCVLFYLHILLNNIQTKFNLKKLNRIENNLI